MIYLKAESWFQILGLFGARQQLATLKIERDTFDAIQQGSIRFSDDHAQFPGARARILTSLPEIIIRNSGPARPEQIHRADYAAAHDDCPFKPRQRRLDQIRSPITDPPIGVEYSNAPALV